MKPVAVVLHDEIDRERASADDLDTLEAAEAISATLTARGYEVQTLPFTADLTAMRARLHALRPAFVFQSVERVGGDPNLLPVVPLLLRNLGIAYSGCDAESLAATISKVHTKRWLRAAGIVTADWATMHEALPFSEDWLGIVKPESEHSSFGMNDSSVVRGAKAAFTAMRERAGRLGGNWFAETFLDGREFHIGLLETRESDPLVLPPIEISFLNYPPSKPRIMSFDSKWTSDSFEQTNTQVALLSDPAGQLIAQLQDIARRCWRLFGMSGYARIDMRTDAGGKLHVLEVNANPCFWEGSSYGLAAGSVGFGYDAIIDQLIAAAERRRQVSPTLNPNLSPTLSRTSGASSHPAASPPPSGPPPSGRSQSSSSSA